MAQWLGAHAALAKYLGSILSTHVVTDTAIDNSRPRGSNAFFCTLRSGGIHVVQTCPQGTLTQTKHKVKNLNGIQERQHSHSQLFSENPPCSLLAPESQVQVPGKVKWE